MRILVTVKSPGRKKGFLENIPYELEPPPLTGTGLITALVQQEVKRFNSKETDAKLVGLLTGEQIEESAQTGKVGFGRIFSSRKVAEEKAVDTALQAWEDGIVKVLVNERVIEDDNEPLTLREGDIVTFVRLTFLSGRLW